MREADIGHIYCTGHFLWQGAVVNLKTKECRLNSYLTLEYVKQTLENTLFESEELNS